MNLGVSIIIPAYNAAQTIRETLQSVIAQTHADWEAIVVIDGCTDTTEEVVQGFTERDTRIHLVKQNRGGEASARNAGLAMARNEWLLFLDADDWIAPTHLERMTRELASNPGLEAVHCGSARVAGDGTLVVEKYLPPEGDLFPTLARRAAFPVHACIVRRSLVERVGKFDPSLIKSPDWDLWQRIARTGARFGAVRDVLAFYRMSPNAASLDAQQLLKDGLTVIRRGHSPDPRVLNPHPDYANGSPPAHVREQEFYLLCWCAGLLLGAGKDARPLLELVKDGPAQLYPDAVAQCIFEAAPLSTCHPPGIWEKLAHEILESTDEFLAALEKKTEIPELADQTVDRLKAKILFHSPFWKPVIERYEKTIKHWQGIAEDREKWRGHWEKIAREQEKISDDREKWRAHWKEIADKREKERDDWQNVSDEREKWRVHWQEVAVRKEKEREEWQTIADEREKWRIHWEEVAEKREKESAKWKHIATERKSILAEFKKRLWVRSGIWLGFLKDPSNETLQPGQPPPNLPLDKGEESLSGTISLQFRRIAGLAILVSLLHCIFFAANSPLKLTSWLGLFAAIATIWLSVKFLQRNRVSYLIVIFDIYCVQLGLFIYQLFSQSASSVPRLFQTGLLLLNIAIVFSLILSASRVMSRSRAVLSSFSAVFVIFISEIVAGALFPAQTPRSLDTPHWNKVMKSHPKLGLVFPSSSVVRIEHNEDPEDYYGEVDPRNRKYRLRVAGESSAQLILPENSRDLVRITIKRISPDMASNIQLNLPVYSVVAGRKYTIQFRARADHPRRIIAGFARDHDPWTGLGFYKLFQLTEKWQTFREDFIVSSNDENARIHFDLGDSDISVEFSSVELRNPIDGSLIVQVIPGRKYTVDYRFNSMGCRGPDSAIPQPPETERILLLGDEYTLGSGIYEENTLSSRLERLLNERGPEGSGNHSYEVLNCGEFGFGTQEETIFYELFGTKYRPNLVLLLMNSDDDMSYVEAVRHKYVDRIPDRLESLFHTWAKIQDSRYRRPAPDFARSVEEILQLDKKVRQNSSRLAVIIFRNNLDYEGSTQDGKNWNRLTHTVIKGLEGKQIPILDMGRVLFEEAGPKAKETKLERAHEVAPGTIIKFLETQKLLKK